MSKITSYSIDYQTFPALFELEPVAGKKVTVDFSAPELSSLGGLPLVRNMKSRLTASSNASNPVSKIRAGNPWWYTARRRCSARGYTR